jgi:long-chain acyl-CoA synthetase
MSLNARPWLNEYTPGIPADIDPDAYPSLVALLQDCFEKYAHRTAFTFLGHDLSYAELDRLSQVFAAYLQSLGLQRGDRVGIMLPNVMQYPIVVAAILRAGLVIVNINPLYTPRELEHQLKDSGARAVIILENFAATLQACLNKTSVQHVVLCAMGDSVGWLKGALVNYVVRRVKKMVPPFQLPHAVRFSKALAMGERSTFTAPPVASDDLAVLQYTGGTTGVAKGAELLHRNLVANTLQAHAWNWPAMQLHPEDDPLQFVCALPLYHIFAFTVNMMLPLRMGARVILIPNPRDLNAVIKELSNYRIHIFPAVNTLFNALLNHPDFERVDWSHLVVSLGGGTAVQSSVAKRWLARTGCAICEGYGLSETSPVVSCNLVLNKTFTDTIGLPMSSTEMKIIDNDGRDVPMGQPGEIAIRGPQVMAGYWQRPDETARAMTADGYFKTGDIGVMDERGYFRIVDRKKDTILVSGFNVYPNEVEDVVSELPGVLECAVIGVPDERTGEAVKLVVVKKDPNLTEAQLREHCHRNLTNYKNPRWIEFRRDLPKTPIGKVLRRELREKS